MKEKLLIITIVAAIFILGSCSLSGARERAKDVTLPTVLKTPKRSKTTPKVIAFGDSLTAGFGLSEKESYPFLLQQKIDRDGFDIEVINAGVSGDTSLGGVSRIEWVLGQENVKILILELGANDLLRGVPVKEMRENLEKIIVKAKEKDVQVLFCGMLAPPTMGEEYRKEFVDTFPELATKYDLVYLPFLLENVAANKDLNQADGIHPNAKGTEIMTSNVYSELKPMLKKLTEAVN